MKCLTSITVLAGVAVCFDHNDNPLMRMLAQVQRAQAEQAQAQALARAQAQQAQLAQAEAVRAASTRFMAPRMLQAANVVAASSVSQPTVSQPTVSHPTSDQDLAQYYQNLYNQLLASHGGHTSTAAPGYTGTATTKADSHAAEKDVFNKYLESLGIVIPTFPPVSDLLSGLPGFSHNQTTDNHTDYFSTLTKSMLSGNLSDLAHFADKNLTTHGLNLTALGIPSLDDMMKLNMTHGVNLTSLGLPTFQEMSDDMAEKLNMTHGLFNITTGSIFGNFNNATQGFFSAGLAQQLMDGLAKISSLQDTLNALADQLNQALAALGLAAPPTAATTASPSRRMLAGYTKRGLVY